MALVAKSKKLSTDGRVFVVRARGVVFVFSACARVRVVCLSMAMARTWAVEVVCFALDVLFEKK